VGQGYSTIAIIPETEGSWALPLLHERITSFTNPIEKPPNSDLSAKICQLAHYLWDAEYGCASFVKQTADIMADKLMRLRSNHSTARRHLTQALVVPVHGDKFKLNDPTTWCPPNHMLVHDQSWDDCACVYGRISIFNSLHCTRCI
jgi:hypothetical protein